MDKTFLPKKLVAILSFLALFLSACGDDSSTSAENDSGKTGSSKSKVWFVVGDSFSHGDWTGADQVPVIKSGKYAGKLPVYSYLIGNRANYDVRNISENGYLLSMIEGSDATNTFTHPQGKLYTTDFSGADIITIYLGINDSYHDVPVGTLDDTEPTSFLGAWNVAISYLLEHYPSAKLGIIVSNACFTADFPNATVDVAKKWNLPYLDLDGGVNGVTMILSSSRNPASDYEKERALLEQRVCTTNMHPNEYAHALESKIIEEWLGTL